MYLRAGFSVKLKTNFTNIFGSAENEKNQVDFRSNPANLLSGIFLFEYLEYVK